MIQSLKKLLRRAAVIPPSRHMIKENDISSDVMRVVGALQDHGHTAYIVGGAVRDTLLGFHPKDFDVATDAQPEQLRALFGKRSRVIGKRFPIVHVYPAKRTCRPPPYTEVATFRGSKDYYGDAYDDAYRRDFTINGIFYDPISRKLYDYVGGAADITKKRLRIIGKADKRLPEDPVRILRALRLSTKLGLSMSTRLEKQLANYVPLLTDIPAARLFDEMAKVINSGASARIFQKWRQFGICKHIIPTLQEENPLFFSVLAENDRRLAEKRTSSMSFIIAALFWHEVAGEWHQRRKQGASPAQAMEQALGAVPFRRNFIIPNRLTAKAKDLYFLQAQMENTPTLRRSQKIIVKPFFDRALAFASLRQDAGAAQTASWWSQFIQGSAEERERLLQNAPKEKRRRRKHTAVQKNP